MTKRTRPHKSEWQMRWQTERQRRAFRHYCYRGADDLTPQELKVLAKHPYVDAKERAKFVEMLQD